jgi:hypothetical protein
VWAGCRQQPVANDFHTFGRIGQGLDCGIVDVHHRDAVLGERFDELVLGRGDRLERTKGFEVSRADGGQHTNVRTHQPAELCDVSGVPGSHLHYEEAVVFLEALVDGSHHTQRSVERAGCGHDLLGRRNQSLHRGPGGGLAEGSGDAHHHRADLCEQGLGPARKAPVDGGLHRSEQDIGRSQ